MKLYLIPSFIAENQTAADLPQSVLNVISGLTHYLVENERTARRFISSLSLGIHIPNLKLSVLDKNTSPHTLPALMAPLLNGENMGVISEAGCPGIADPGSLAVDFAHRNGIEVVPLTGPSSILLALMASGFNGQRFCFHGYLPVQEAERKKAIRKLEEESAKLNQTQIFIETPYRNNQLFQSLVKTCQPGTLLCVARDIQGPSNSVKTRQIAEWRKEKIELHKIPVVFIIHSR